MHYQGQSALLLNCGWIKVLREGAGHEELEGRLKSREGKPSPTRQGLGQQQGPQQGQAGDGQTWEVLQCQGLAPHLSTAPPFCRVGRCGRGRLGELYVTYVGRQHLVERGGLWNQTDFQTVHDP